MSRAGPGIAERMEQIHPFYVMQLLARARELERQGRRIVHMEIGEPDFVTPDPIIQAAHQALEAGRTHYTPALGLHELRQSIAGRCSQRLSLALRASCVKL